MHNIVEPVKNQWPMNWMALSDFFTEEISLTLHLTDAYRAAERIIRGILLPALFLGDKPRS